MFESIAKPGASKEAAARGDKPWPSTPGQLLRTEKLLRKEQSDVGKYLRCAKGARQCCKGFVGGGCSSAKKSDFDIDKDCVC